jgi:hypothetical protein
MRRIQALAANLRALALGALVIGGLRPGVAEAQSTRQLIDSAVTLYDAFNIEAARPILLRIVSPGYLQQVTSADKALAYKYLGASYAVLAAPDSAEAFFKAALDFDAFTSLDPEKFAAAEITAFEVAKTKLFKLGILPMGRQYLLVPQSNSDTAAYTFRLITTQRATLTVDILGQDTTKVRERLYSGPNDGVRPLPFKGVLGSTGTFIPVGLYTLRAIATQAGGGAPVVETMVFSVEHIYEPLEDTLNTLDPARELLPPRIKSSAPWYDLGKGGWVAVSATVLPLVVALNKKSVDNASMSWAPHAAASATIGLLSAAGSFWYRRSRPEIRANIDENNRRQTIRTRFNEAVTRRNTDRLNRRLIVISPVAGR